jgi:CheY-like chemotaxis protein
MPKKLLLADDSVTIQRVIELTFADEDVDVTTVGDGRQAIDRLRAERPDIVLADIGMPERDGYEVAAFIKNDPQLAHIPVILLTGAFEPLDEHRARTVGCDGVLVKPFEPQMVINRVMELLASRRPAAPAPPPAPAPAPHPAAAPVQPSSAAPVRSAEAFAAALDASLEPRPETKTQKTNDPLEAYFDRLDAAFANISAPGGRSRPPAPPDDVPGAISELHEPPPPQARSQDPVRSSAPDLAASPGGVRQPDAAPARPPDPAPAPPPDPVPAPQPAPAQAIQPDLANAFSALLAAEQGQPSPEAAFAFGLAPRLGDDDIEQIVQRVIARLTDDTVRRTVLDTAERLVREEIERIKRQARTGGSSPQTGR